MKRFVFFLLPLLLSAQLLAGRGELVSWSEEIAGLENVGYYVVERGTTPIAIVPHPKLFFIDWGGEQDDTYRTKVVFTDSQADTYIECRDYVVIEEDNIPMTWKDNSNNETGFEIQQKIGDGPYVFLATVPMDVNRFTALSVQESVKYTYRVRAFNSVGYSNFSNELFTFVLLKKPVNVILSSN